MGNDAATAGGARSAAPGLRSADEGRPHRDGGAKSRVRPVAVVLHGSETVRDENQSPGALVLDGADAAFDDGETAVLADGTEPLP